MDLTSGTRTMASVSAAVMLGGIGLTLHGVWRDQPTHSLAGVVLNMIALTVIILTTVHHWVTNTSTERTALAAAVSAPSGTIALRALALSLNQDRSASSTKASARSSRTVTCLFSLQPTRIGPAALSHAPSTW